ncbi:hypothetical protein PoMZ_10501 [Pyricularia oryzae]|uniref:Uncharacterized protein n=1 Tax=Pyricularia oryzae TaxID=318829 RepID=A0A4P7N0E2_PYROR|nr:hypothetical protein PoMZ_10501 [Pyricularia oryzae]
MRARQSRQKKLVRLATATAIRVRAHLATCKSSCRCGWMPPVAITSNECRGKKAHRHRTSSGEWWKLITRPAAGRLVNFHCLVFRSRDIAFCKKNSTSVSHLRQFLRHVSSHSSARTADVCMEYTDGQRLEPLAFRVLTEQNEWKEWINNVEVISSTF